MLHYFRDVSETISPSRKRKADDLKDPPTDDMDNEPITRFGTITDAETWNARLTLGYQVDTRYISYWEVNHAGGYTRKPGDQASCALEICEVASKLMRTRNTTGGAVAPRKKQKQVVWLARNKLLESTAQLGRSHYRVKPGKG